jgi:hypothetical protein
MPEQFEACDEGYAAKCAWKMIDLPLVQSKVHKTGWHALRLDAQFACAQLLLANPRMYPFQWPKLLVCVGPLGSHWAIDNIQIFAVLKYFSSPVKTYAWENELSTV